MLVVIAVEYGGLGNHIPLLKTIRLTTLLSYLLLILVVARIGVAKLFSSPQVRIFVALTVMTAASVIWALVRTYVLESARSMIDYLAFMIVVATVIDRRKRFDVLSCLFAFICIFLVATNLEKLTSGVRSGPLLASYFMGDGNDFAWGLVVAFPFVLNLVIGERSLLVRMLGLLGIGACLVGIVGTGSRGATVGLAAMVGFYWLFLSQRKVLVAFAIALCVAGILVTAPTTYLDRMQSVSDYKDDSSAQGRLQAWRASVRMAIDHPLGVGGGNFSSAYGRHYMPSIEKNAIGWAPGRWLSAHSIYFRVLGEYGFLGLALLLAVIWLNIRDNLRSQRHFSKVGQSAPVPATWPALVNMSMIGFAVCGLFLGGLSYPHLFLLTGLTVSTSLLCIQSQTNATVSVQNSVPRARTRSPASPSADSRSSFPRKL